jgi:predicted TIM-barrel fold metal-dependent hydrolase
MTLPLHFDPVSNGEYLPPRKTARVATMQEIAWSLVEKGVRRTGLSRRAFLRSTCGMAACLAAINQASGSTAGSYVLPKEATLDRAAADSVLAGDEFIFDIQTHHVQPARTKGWAMGGRYEYVKEIFLDSDTTCAVLSALPAAEEKNPLSQAEAETTREIIESIGKSKRLWVHALVTPNYGDVKRHLDGMEEVSKKNKIAAWKLYTLLGPEGRGFWHHDEKLGIPVIEKARELGIKLICTHKGFPFGKLPERYDTAKDIGIVARRFPDVNFIVYHSGYIPRVKEGPYDAGSAEEGVNALIKSVEDNGIKPGSNVYAELGSTWWTLMKKPDQAAHVLGKLLKTFGPDNVLWGTDCLWYGSPQPQIAAFRAFQISEELREKHGYPELTPELKAKILGLSSAKVYGVEPKRDLPKIQKDDVEKLKQAYLPDRDPSHRVYGPRTRREFFELLALRGGRPA